MSVKRLATTIKEAVDKRIKEEARAKSGIIKDGMFQTGLKSYPYKQAVECDLSGRLWAQLDTLGNAVVVGA